MDYEIFAFRQIFRIVQETQIFALYFHGILWVFFFFFWDGKKEFSVVTNSSNQMLQMPLEIHLFCI